MTEEEDDGLVDREESLVDREDMEESTEEERSAPADFGLSGSVSSSSISSI